MSDIKRIDTNAYVTVQGQYAVVKDLAELIQYIENLKEKVSIYQHNSYKYRWSTSLENNVLAKLRKIMDRLKN
ncbi:hypothetical protein H6G25_16310 [Dolichospermum sp. FACHB-1091]|jgi:hypothetical protein|uniref:hypothetical protein n=1 Tax=Dolichospermum sp. FACHB-1091 TaxID=2692798 RepID=UPI0016811827|nr:hypothetical protein [Dolichospermum sp. FACHB-1091]MBD2444722.1 hypothetical protein [Dolichospermum sp. FACHB-1091]